MEVIMVGWEASLSCCALSTVLWSLVNAGSWIIRCFTSECIDLAVDHIMHGFCRRPYFTYWLMFVHVVIMITALAVYGFAPYGWDFIERRELVRQTDLSFAVVPKSVVPSVWGGPPQQALVLLGALYAPCMRRDRQLFEGIEADRQMENTSSGCCVRRDESGCFQAILRSDCPV